MPPASCTEHFRECEACSLYGESESRIQTYKHTLHNRICLSGDCTLKVHDNSLLDGYRQPQHDVNGEVCLCFVSSTCAIVILGNLQENLRLNSCLGPPSTALLYQKFSLLMPLAKRIVKRGMKLETGSRCRCVTYYVKFLFSMRLHEIRKTRYYWEPVRARLTPPPPPGHLRVSSPIPLFSKERCEHGN
jgi:hypothetical protein